MNSIRPNRNLAQLLPLYDARVLPTKLDLDNLIRFLGVPRIDQTFQVMAVCVLWELIPPRWDSKKSKTANRKILAAYVANFRFICTVAGIKIARSACVGMIFTGLQWRGFVSTYGWQEASDLLKHYYNFLET